MDPVHLAVAFTPLAVYLLYLGVINLSRRPTVTTGVKNAGAMGLALVGFVAVGPMGLFVPDAAVFAFGPWLWLLLLVFYGLCVTLWILLARPRLIIFNATAEQLRPVLAEVVAKIDSDVRWAGDSLMLPQVGLQFHLEPYRADAKFVAGGDGRPTELYRVAAARAHELRAAFRGTGGGEKPAGVQLFDDRTLGTGELAGLPDGARYVTRSARALRDMLHM